MAAVIDEASFDKLASYIDNAKKDPVAEIVYGGGYDKSEGYFVQPTVIKVTDPKYVTMCEELFGPFLPFMFILLRSGQRLWNWLTAPRLMALPVR